MRFISYAQNYEDVMLWRALKNVEVGFYIDAGANDPDYDSVTKAFYERGWHGINIEPVPQWFERLQKSRPRDINLQLAVGAEPGEITLYEIPETGLSTAEEEFAKRHVAERGYQNHELRVKVNTLSAICERFPPTPIHFLKIDVEGAEKAVLQGTDFGKIRPWIIVVEATLPNSQEEYYSDWEPLLLNAGYTYVYFDGLNRYYIAVEHGNLKSAFNAPPNIFDQFVRSDQLELEHRAQEMETMVKEIRQQTSQAEARAQEAETLACQAKEEAAQTQAKAEQAEARAQEAQAKARQAEEEAALAQAKTEQAEVKARQAEASAQQAQQRAIKAEAHAKFVETCARQAEERATLAETTLQEVFNSRSWQATEPIRKWAATVRTWRKNNLHRKTSNGWGHASSMPAPLGTTLQELKELSPRAREIYFQLKDAIEKNQESK